MQLEELQDASEQQCDWESESDQRRLGAGADLVSGGEESVGSVGGDHPEEQHDGEGE